VRYAFASYGERDVGFAPSEARLILDHMEGVEPTDVTGLFYSSAPKIGRKRELVQAWTDWCDSSIREDPALHDRDLMQAEIRRARYRRSDAEEEAA
jgi:hypothetical protein